MCALNTCAATMTPMTEYDVPGVRWIMYDLLYVNAICKIFKCEKILYVLPAFRQFSLLQREYKSVLEWKISNLKLAWEEEVEVFLK